MPQVASTADDGGIENAQDDQTLDVSGTPPAAGDDENTQEQPPSDLERLKDEMKKDAPLLEYVPLDDIKITTQTAVPNTVPQTFEIGTAPGPNGRRLTLMACMATQGIITKTGGGWPRLMTFGVDKKGFADRHKFTTRQVPKLDTLNASFAPANTKPDTLNSFIKYVFLAKYAPLPNDATVKSGFTRALGQAYRACKRLAKKQAAAQQEKPEEDDKIIEEEEFDVVAEEKEDIEMLNAQSEVGDAEQDISAPPSPSKSSEEGTTLVGTPDVTRKTLSVKRYQ